MGSFYRRIRRRAGAVSGYPRVAEASFVAYSHASRKVRYVNRCSYREHSANIWPLNIKGMK